MSPTDRAGTSAAELFDLLWESLADVLGTAASATLLRRAIKKAAARTAWTEPVVIVRDGVDYVYRLPKRWMQPGDDGTVDELRVIASELRALLVELTGPVMVARLGQLAPLRKWGIDFSVEAKGE